MADKQDRTRECPCRCEGYLLRYPSTRLQFWIPPSSSHQPWYIPHSTPSRNTNSQGVVPKSQYSWRSLYFIGAGFSVLAAIVRACLPESQQFILARQEAKNSNLSSSAQSKAFGREIWMMLKTNWVRCIWAICIMTGRFFICSFAESDIDDRLQLLFTWKSGSLPRLFRDYKRVLQLRCFQSYHHQ